MLYNCYRDTVRKSNSQVPSPLCDLLWFHRNTSVDIMSMNIKEATGSNLPETNHGYPKINKSHVNLSIYFFLPIKENRNRSHLKANSSIPDSSRLQTEMRRRLYCCFKRDADLSLTQTHISCRYRH